MESRGVTRKELRKRKEGIRTNEVKNNIIQNKGKKTQVIGSNVEAL